MEKIIQNYLNEEHHNQRSRLKRVNKYLKEDFRCNTIYYRGATKVASILAFGIFFLYSSKFKTCNLTIQAKKYKNYICFCYQTIKHTLRVVIF